VCGSPSAYITNNCTSWVNWQVVPTMYRSKAFQVQAYSSVKCNASVPTSMYWSAYYVTLVTDSTSPAGKTEKLTQININQTMPSFTTTLLSVPSLAFNYGLVKLVYRFQVETFDPTVQLYREAWTYVNVTKSPLQPVLIQGSVAQVSRGWGQAITMSPQNLSIDPDYPGDQVGTPQTYP
jgi:hypothetical protein